MTWVYLALFLIALIVCVTIGERLFHRITEKKLSQKHPDYHRSLTQSEARFVAEAEIRLRLYASDKSYKNRWNWPLYFSFIPVMLGLFVIGAWVYSVINAMDVAVYKRLNPHLDILFIQTDLVWASAIIAMFAVIFGAGWLSYVLTGFNRKFTDWMVLTQSSYNQSESDESILKRRVTQIEHDVRIRRLDVDQPFYPSAFLRSIARQHGRYCGIITLVILTPALIFLPLDLRHKVVFTSDALLVTGYWSGEITAIAYPDMSAAEIECAYGHKNKRNIAVNFMQDGERVAYYNFSAKNLDAFSDIDDRLRATNVPFKKHYYHPKGRGPKLAYTSKCVQSLRSDFIGAILDKMVKVFHLDEL